MNNASISIIIPVYNAEKCISDTIASIRSQSYKDWELILVDDGSTDNTADVIQSWKNEGIIHIVKKNESENFGMVLQDTWVFEGTIFDNIAYGKENATMDKMDEIFFFIIFSFL